MAPQAGSRAHEPSLRRTALSLILIGQLASWNACLCSPLQTTTTTNGTCVLATGESGSRNDSSSFLVAPKSAPASDADLEWNFTFEEYDLMDYLQNMSARYNNNNDNKQQEAAPATTSDIKRPVDLAHSQPESQLEAKSHDEPLGLAAPKSASAATTRLPEIATSLASLNADQEIGESSWQYGIFDRFTRARSTSTTTPEPKFTLDPHADIDMRSFNSDECGLRTYAEQRAEPELQYPLEYPAPGSEMSDASKELNHRRQRPGGLFGNKPPQSDRWYQFESAYPHKPPHAVLMDESARPETSATTNDNSNDQYASVKQQHHQQNIANWPNKDEKENYDNFKKNFDAISSSFGSSAPGANSPPASDNNHNEEFNLLARRHWLQQQLGNTLQMFAFNSSLSSLAELLANNNSSSLLPAALANSSWSEAPVARRENLMKKFGNLRAARKEGPDSGADPLAQLPPLSSSHFNKELKARQDELKLEARVIGGNDARLGDSPWSVSLQALVSRPGTGQVEYRHYCGGTIISEHYILTAAHCLDFMVGRESRLFVVIGDLNWRMSAGSQYGRRYAIERLLIHSGYKNTAFGHDIGLIKTKERIKPLKLNGRYIINSVCLPDKGVEHTGEAELVGWGLFSNRNEMADSLQIAEVPILPRPLCVDLYRRRTGLIQWLIGIELITEKQVCAGTFGRGICQGDSGSALVVNEKLAQSGSYSSHHRAAHLQQQAPAAPTRQLAGRRPEDTRATIIGIVAFGGIRRCSYQSLPGVYMQTSKYMDWILPRIQATTAS